MSEGKKLRILREVLGDCYRSGEEHLFGCPKCGHHKKKLSVNVSKNVYKCWVCDWSGRNLRRVVRTYGDLNHKREWSELTSHVDTSDLSEDLFEKPPEEKEQTVKLPDSFESLANKETKYGAVWPLRYLRERGITKSDIGIDKERIKEKISERKKDLKNDKPKVKDVVIRKWKVLKKKDINVSWGQKESQVKTH